MLNFVAGIALLYFGLCAALYFFQRSLIYFPQPASAAPGQVIISLSKPPEAHTKVLVSTRPKQGPEAVLYFGGNAENVAYSLPEMAAAFPHHALYLMHYRGYGGSAGKPSEAALFADAVALFDQVFAEHPEIVVVGRSLGSGVAAYLASVRPVVRLVLVAPYDSIEAIAAQQFPIFPVRWLLRDKYQSWKYASRIKVPTLLIAAEFDEVIPRRNTEALASHFRPGIASLQIVPGTSHNTISDSAEYVRLLAPGVHNPAKPSRIR